MLDVNVWSYIAEQGQAESFVDLERKLGLETVVPASMLLEALHGKTVDDVKEFSAEDMLELYGPRLTPNRQKCCLLSWKVLQSAVHSPIEGGKS